MRDFYANTLKFDPPLLRAGPVNTNGFKNVRTAHIFLSTTEIYKT